MNAAIVLLVVIVALIATLSGIVGMADTIAALKDAVAFKDKQLAIADEFVSRRRSDREELATLKIRHSKLTDKHEAATRRIAELGRIVRLGTEGGGA